MTILGIDVGNSDTKSQNTIFPSGYDGLPVAHYKKKYIENLLAYYQKYMGTGITFYYNDYCFSFIMDVCRIYPQGGAAAACSTNKIAAVYNTYYVIDIGGYTVDVAQFKNDIPSRDRLSLEMGIIILYDSIIEKIFAECDIHIDYDSIESVLHGQNTILPEKAISIIKELTDKHAGNILNYLRQQKIRFDSHPCLFVGGGSVMLKDSIMNNPLIRKDAVQFITDTKANAKGYARLVSMEYPEEAPR